jgi:hypothetical protein
MNSAYRHQHKPMLSCLPRCCMPVWAHSAAGVPAAACPGSAVRSTHILPVVGEGGNQALSHSTCAGAACPL